MSYKGIKFNGKVLDIPQEYLKSVEVSDGVLTVYDATDKKYTFSIPEGLATEDFVRQQIASLVNSAPETLDTLGELATALEENQDVVEALNDSIANKADKTEVETVISQLQTKNTEQDAQISEKISVSDVKTLSISSTGDGYYVLQTDGTIKVSGGSTSLKYSPITGQTGTNSTFVRTSVLSSFLNGHNNIVARVKELEGKEITIETATTDEIDALFT